MNVYEYSPPKSNKKASGIILILFSLAAGLFLFTLLFPNIPFKWAIQLISIVFFVALLIYAVTRLMDAQNSKIVIEENKEKAEIELPSEAQENISDDSE